METTQFTRPAKAYYSTTELVAYLYDYAGMRVTTNTVHKWTMAGKIPVRRAPNGRLLYPVKAIQDWLEGNAEKVEA